jgi:hypothetical protein
MWRGITFASSQVLKLSFQIWSWRSGRPFWFSKYDSHSICLSKWKVRRYQMGITSRKSEDTQCDIQMVQNIFNFFTIFNQWVYQIFWYQNRVLSKSSCRIGRYVSTLLHKIWWPEMNERLSGMSQTGCCLRLVYHQRKQRDRRAIDRMVVGFTTTCAISAYHH